MNMSEAGMTTRDGKTRPVKKYSGKIIYP